MLHFQSVEAQEQYSTNVSSSPNRQPPQYDRGPSILTADQKTKLQGELDLVESNSKVLAEMLNELSPGKEQPEDLQLLQVILYYLFRLGVGSSVSIFRA